MYDLPVGFERRVRVFHVGAANGTTKQNDAVDKDAAQYVPEKARQTATYTVP